MNPGNSNEIFQLASDFVNHTGRHIFLTGKAGTGKTTFLKYIQSTTRKNCITVAPTGVAAINAGGVTMHSFFQLPLGPFLPISSSGFQQEEVTDMHSLFRHMRMSSNKRQIMNELDLLIIDEVSMLRADMLDAIDTILRHFRRQQHLPFGGVQVLYIGDMYQLPPVIKDDEWQMLSDHYNSPFFFDAKVIQQAPPLYIELKKIYRQNEQRFIDILNRIRDNNTIAEDLAILNAKWQPEFTASADEKYITLCTHNYKADHINQTELERLETKEAIYKGELTGEFNEKALPVDMNLKLKPGAQVMFIKNDKGEARRYYNGKLAVIKELSDTKITVVLAGSEQIVELEKEVWRNIRYRLNEAKTHIEEEELGTYSQYPIKLAWAITIHKSQGLTFEKAVIDAGQSFAAGQVYVALSRCTSLDGLVLYSRIHPSSINTDIRVIEFAKKEAALDEMPLLLEAERNMFESKRLKKIFNWNKLLLAFETWREDLATKKIDHIEDAVLLADNLVGDLVLQQEIAIKFQKQLDGLLQLQNDASMTFLHERMHKAIAHFSKALYTEIAEPLSKHIEAVSKQKRVKQYLLELKGLDQLVWDKLDELWHACFKDMQFGDGVETYKRKPLNFKPAKPAPGSTRIESLNLFKAGSSIEEIALQRSLTKGTIEGHLAESIGKGELLLTEVLTSDRIKAIMDLGEKLGWADSNLIKAGLGNDYSYGEIRMVQQYVRNNG
jgi:nucleoside-triphosphatase THEP1